jgi:FeS assembly SUF system protein
MALFEVENLHAKIDDKKILKNVDLVVNAGEMHAIMGRTVRPKWISDAGDPESTGILRMTDEAKTTGTESASPAGLGEAGGAAPAAAAANAADRPPTIPADELARLTDGIVAALKTVYDPEIPADLYELGLIYKVDIDDHRTVTIEMTLTTPNCPSAAEMPGQVENAVAGVSGVRQAIVNIVWDPPWEPSRMSDEARTVLDMW